MMVPRLRLRPRRPPCERFFCFFIAASCSLAAAAADLYVSTEGQDAWSGQSAEPNAAQTDGPFATLQRARDEIRRIKAGGELSEPLTVHVRAGLYALPQTLKLDAQDSGTAEAPVVWRGYQAERPELIGGRPVAGFQPHQGEILKADLRGQGLEGVVFRQLIFDGRRQHLARYPNFDPQNPYGGGWAYADGKPVPMYEEVPGEDRRTLHYKAERRARLGAAGGGRGVRLPPLQLVEQHRPHRSRSTATRGRSRWPATARIRSAPATATTSATCSRNSMRRASGISTSAPGRSTSGRPQPLTGRPSGVRADAARPSSSSARARRTSTFRGFTFECCEGTAVVLQGHHATACIAGCTIRNVGDYGGSGVAISGGTDNGVVGCDIYEIGSDGVSPQRRRPQDAHRRPGTTRTTTTSTTSACSTSRAWASR